jgi:hypothetical protein
MCVRIEVIDRIAVGAQTRCWRGPLADVRTTAEIVALHPLSSNDPRAPSSGRMIARVLHNAVTAVGCG